jgi:hypothetical protein
MKTRSSFPRGQSFKYLRSKAIMWGHITRSHNLAQGTHAAALAAYTNVPVLDIGLRGFAKPASIITTLSSNWPAYSRKIRMHIQAEIPHHRTSASRFSTDLIVRSYLLIPVLPSEWSHSVASLLREDLGKLLWSEI